jgi:amidase
MSEADLLVDADCGLIADAVRSGDTSPAETVAAAISRTEAADAKYSFLVAERFDAALAEAEGIKPTGPLAGVPILIKDYAATVKGLPLTDGSRFVRDWPAPCDCEWVTLVKDAGAIVLGSVASSEFCLLPTTHSRRHGVTKNPRVAGISTAGSSGGSGAAVASGAVPLAHGSDAGGSIRLPASCCGLVGLKPSRGRNPLAIADQDLAALLFVEHALTRTVTDAALLLDVTGRPLAGEHKALDGEDSFWAASLHPSTNVRLGVCSRLPDGRPLHPDSKAALDNTADCLSALGYEIIECDPRIDVRGGEDAYLTVFSKSLANRVAMWIRELGREPEQDGLEPYSRRLYEQGSRSSNDDVENAVAKLKSVASEFEGMFSTIDVWLSPTLGTPSFEPEFFAVDLAYEEILAHDGVVTAFTWPSNVGGQPAISYPASETSDGVQVGVQLTGRFGDERSILSVAGDLERNLRRDSRVVHEDS